MSQQNKNNGNKGDLTTGSLAGHLLRLTIPMIWGIFAIISFQLADIYFVSLLGTETLAALSFTFPVNMAVFSLVIGMGISMSSVLARQIGEGNQDNVKRIATHGLILALMVGLFVAVLGCAVMTGLFRAMGASEQILPLVKSYMPLWFASSAFLTIPIVGNAIMRAGGDTRTPALIMTVAALTNVILDPILIFGLFGFPALGLQGAALATLIANICASAAGLYILYARKRVLCRDGLHLSLFSDSCKRLVFIAAAVGITGMFTPLVNGFIISLLVQYGPEAVAAWGIVTRVEAFAFVVIMALASGMSPVLGQNWGAKKYDRVHETLNRAFGFVFLWSLIVAVILGVGSTFIAGLFSDDADVVWIASLYFWIVPVSYIFGNLINGWVSAFNALGMPKRAFLITVGRAFVLTVPLVGLGSALYGYPGIFVALAGVNIVAGIAIHLWSWHVCRVKEDTPVIA